MPLVDYFVPAQLLATSALLSGGFVHGYQEFHDGEQVGEPFKKYIFFLGVASRAEFFFEQLILFVHKVERIHFLQRSLPPLFFIKEI
jgi:hypothetical protein